MRLLLLLPWCFLLALVGGTDCNWKMPTETEECTQIIKWKVRSEKQALSTCLEYFPTTYLKGEIQDITQIKCTVYRKFQCNYLNEFVKKQKKDSNEKWVDELDANNQPIWILDSEWKQPMTMYDKCYKFLTDVGKEETMDEYITTNRAKYCENGGGIPVFFSMSQAKHIAKEAHRRGIFKLWVNVNSDGKTIEESKANGLKKGDMLYKNLWKVQEDIYWEGENIKYTPKSGVPAGNANYLFFRSRTDHVHNLLQGSFERANGKTKASIICEYPAKIVPDVKNYCEKMGAKGLGMNAQYDESRGIQRCVYTTLSKYSLKGTIAATKNFEGCREQPSKEHSVGLDDGTASGKIYNDLTTGGTYRVAAIKSNADIDSEFSKNNFAGHIRQHCEKADAYAKYDHTQMESIRQKQRQPYKIFPHFTGPEYTRLMTSTWADEYPKDECSDFPAGEMNSNTLAIRKGKIIDVPVPVRFPALCSIVSNVDCALNPGLCGDAKLAKKCTDVKDWNADTKLYAKCGCIQFHKDVGGQCKWDGGDNSCGALRDHRYDMWKDGRRVKDVEWDTNIPFGFHTNNPTSDWVDKAVVRKGCKMTFWSHPDTTPRADNFELMTKEVGEYDVPQYEAGTLNGWDKGMSTSAIECSCPGV